MNLIIVADISQELLDPIVEEIKPYLAIRCNTTDSERFLVDPALEIDSIIYEKRQPIDFVLYLQNTNHRYKDFLKMVPYMGDDNDTMYFPNRKVPSNFYCKPEVLSMISNMYKLPLAQYKFHKESPVEFMKDSNIMFMINRLGLPFKNIP